jgi:phage gpG-like protein
MGVERIGEFNFGRVLKAFEMLKSNDMPLLIGKLAQNHFTSGFREGGHMTDESSEGWRQRKQPDKHPGSAILVWSGHLMRSVKLLEYKFDRIAIGTRGIPYADRHNEGITDKLGRQMPKREFLGHSMKLDNKIISLIKNKLDNVWKS